MLRRSLFALAAFACVSLAQAAPAVGQAAPEIQLQDANGKAVKLSDYRGKYVVLEWTNPGCPYVRKHYDSGNMASTQQDATAKGAGDYLEPPKLVAWMKERKVTPTATLMDEEGVAGRAYGARTTPHMYII